MSRWAEGRPAFLAPAANRSEAVNTRGGIRNLTDSRTAGLKGGGGGGGDGSFGGGPPNTFTDLVASEDLAAGALVNVHTVAGAAQMQNANATDASKPAHGFVLAAVANGTSGTFYPPAQFDSALSGLTPGALYYLAASAGAITVTPPSASGNLVQEVGVGTDVGTLVMLPKTGVVLR